MPLVAAAYLSLVAGLLAGLGGAAAAREGLAGWLQGALLLVAVAALVALRIGARPRAALLLLAAAGTLLGWARREEGERCRRAALARDAWVVRLPTAVAPGASVRATLAEPGGCRTRVALVVAAGGGGPGALARVTGAAHPSEGYAELRVGRATVRELEPGGWPYTARHRARAAIDRLFGEQAGLAAALLVAETDGIDRAVRDRFADAGLVHVLSVSGLHVAILAAAIELLAAALRVPRRAATVVALAVMAAYVLLIGCPPPAVRAGGMYAVAAAARLLQRPTSPWAVVAAGGLLPIAGDVAMVRDLGYQLSVGGVAALVANAELMRRTLPVDWPRPARALAGALAASLAASLVTGPIVAYHFGRLSLVSPLANLVAGPIVALMQPALFLALALAPLGAVAAWVADAAGALVKLLDVVATAAAAVPGAAIDVQPSLAVAVLVGAAVASLILAAVAPFPARPLALALAAMATAAWRPLAPGGSGRAELHLLDVGQGDAVALRSPRGRWVIVDAGRIWDGGDAGARTVVPYVRRRGGRVAAFMLSHPHADHVGGAGTVLARLRPGEYWDPAYAEPSGVYGASLDSAARHRVRWRRVRPGDSLVVDGLVVTALAPDSAWASRLRDANEASTVLLVRYGAVRFLLTGDAEHAAEAELVRRWAGRLRADVLKVGHHGSRTSSGASLLAEVRPALALVSVGAGNRYGHPSPEVVARLLDGGAQVLRTDQVGTVVVRTDGRMIEVEADDERWVIPTASSPR